MERDFELDLLRQRMTEMESRHRLEVSILRNEIRTIEKLLRLENDPRTRLAAINIEVVARQGLI